MSVDLILLVIELKKYRADTALEREIQDQFIQFITAFGSEAFKRSCLTGHLTGSGWILDQETQQSVLLLKHKKLNKWLQPGGHADGDQDVYRVALKEVQEETGLVVSTESKEIFDLDVHAIPEYGNVPTHLHFDVRYKFLVPRSAELILSDESHELRWFSLNEIEALGVDSSVLRLKEKSLKHVS